MLSLYNQISRKIESALVIFTADTFYPALANNDID